jgi:carboxymethylenebutenolidase
MRVRGVSIGGAGSPLPALLGLPDGFPPGAAIVVVQEFWGLNGNIESFVHRLGSVGYVAIAPDLFRGKMTEEPNEAKKLAMEMDRPAALEDLRHCVSHVRNLGATAIGVMGFCMGGSLAWQLASTDDRLGAAIPFYGSYEDRDPLCPVQAHFGTEDRFEPAALDELERKLDALGNGSELHRYEGAGHAFMNDTRDAYRPEAAQVAWDRALAFIEGHLGAPVPV